MDPRVKEITEKVRERSELTTRILEEIRKVIVGQEHLVESLLIAFLSNGHILLEGVPGLAKTLAIKTLAKTIRTEFSRIQFTPDLLPADLIGTRIFNQKTCEFMTAKGPIFTNFVLADEINRAPAKVQSALLECMEERQVTIERETYKLEEPFLVMATQNPIETEGTYPLSEAQVDRFMLKIDLGYPSKEEEAQIVKRMAIEKSLSKEIPVQTVASAKDLIGARELVDQIYVDDKIVRYIVDIVRATRYPEEYGLKIGGYLRFGASPRASLYLTQVSRARAFLRRRGWVTPDDVKAMAPDILRHRIILSYEAEAEELTPDAIISEILASVEVP